MGKLHQFCTFTVDEHYFGIDVLKVQEIIRYQQMTRVPLAPPMVRGLINLRGQIVTAIELRRRLNMSERSDAQLPINVVIQTEDGAFSLLVDEIGDVLEVDERDFERPPETLTGHARDLICGVYKLPHQLLLILDTDRLVKFSGDSRELARVSQT